MLGYYFRIYEGIYGRPCSAMHDPLAAALAVGAVKPALAPVVRAAVDTSDGPSRGQTVCDMRGLYAGYPEVEGARCRVVLSLEDDFAPDLVETLLGHFVGDPTPRRAAAATA
ncbi:inosine-uridine nucleoside N-ribohydrolase [Pseudarthrobacter oxydans]|uniref:Inosine-uridine nucleoside N-ribohydrolase n=1 Tax=Pseudarthrobacter oxydans TaxID=1671 RepID=A0AAW8NGE0_PSEOX|nr:inosine-uridine nucleoside N-ribohydrolase [Pseudarthrobacter oxydans]MDR7166146.1 inosine-uridine nucleoside N-ribohydrolase [Pseudarthrobacter oxydans]